MRISRFGNRVQIGRIFLHVGRRASTGYLAAFSFISQTILKKTIPKQNKNTVKSGVHSCQPSSRSGRVTKYKGGQQKEPSHREDRSGLGNSGFFTNAFRFIIFPDHWFGDVFLL